MTEHTSRPSVRTETDGAVRHVVLCRPERLNALTPGLRDELTAALDHAETDPTVKVILLRAEGRAFCAGFALDTSTQAQAQTDSTSLFLKLSYPFVRAPSTSRSCPAKRAVKGQAIAEPPIRQWNSEDPKDESEDVREDAKWYGKNGVYGAYDEPL